jgi:hypothetical protein
MKVHSFSILLLAAACGRAEPSSVMEKFDPSSPAASMAAVKAGATDSRIVLSKNLEALGDVYQHGEFPLEFSFHVEGSQPLVVTQLESSCGCTDAKMEVDGELYVLGDPILPGAQGFVRGTFKSATYSQEKDSKITIRGNGLGMPQVLRVTAVVYPIFELFPKQARFGDVPLSALRSEHPPSIEVQVLPSREFEIQRWLNTPAGISVEDTGRTAVIEGREPEAKIFRITLGPACEQGRLYETAIAETSLDRTLDFVVQANIFGPIRFDPERRLSFGLMNAGQERSRRINLRATLDGVMSPRPTLSVEGADVFRTEIVEKEAGRFYVLRVRVPNDAPLGHHSAVLRASFPEAAGIDSAEWALKAIIRQ